MRHHDVRILRLPAHEVVSPGVSNVSHGPGFIRRSAADAAQKGPDPRLIIRHWIGSNRKRVNNGRRDGTRSHGSGAAGDQNPITRQVKSPSVLDDSVGVLFELTEAYQVGPGGKTDEETILHARYVAHNHEGGFEDKFEVVVNFQH